MPGCDFTTFAYSHTEVICAWKISRKFERLEAKIKEKFNFSIQSDYDRK